MQTLLVLKYGKFIGILKCDQEKWKFYVILSDFIFTLWVGHLGFLTALRGEGNSPYSLIHVMGGEY
jgi:hypothetical protein